jgi:hypothetical protein
MADESAEKDYSEFHSRIEAYVAEIEKHLNVPAGTVGGTYNDTDFVFVLKMCGIIEPLVKEAIRENIRGAIEHPKTATSGSDALMKAINDLGIDRLRIILYEFGAINERDRSFIQALFDIRNRYAHHIRNAALSIREVCEKIAAEPSGDSRLMTKLLGWQENREPPTEFVDHIRVLMFYNAILMVRDVLKFAKPPPTLGEFLSGVEKQ